MMSSERVRVINPTSAFHNNEGVIRSIDNFAKRGAWLNVFVQLSNQIAPFDVKPVQFSPDELEVIPSFVAGQRFGNTIADPV